MNGSVRLICPECGQKRVLFGVRCRQCGKAAKAALEHVQLAHHQTREIKLGDRRVLLIQRLDNLLRLTSGERIDAKAVHLFGSVCVPVASLPELVTTVRRLARAKRRKREPALQ